MLLAGRDLIVHFSHSKRVGGLSILQRSISIYSLDPKEKHIDSIIYDPLGTIEGYTIQAFMGKVYKLPSPTL